MLLEDGLAGENGEDLPVGKAGLGAAIFNTANTVLGGGALSLPFVYVTIFLPISLSDPTLSACGESLVAFLFSFLSLSPRARFAKIGLGLGIILVALMAVVAAYTGWMLTVTSMQVFGRPSSYAMLSVKAFSPTFGPKFTDISILLFQICTMTSYVIILGDGANKLLDEFFAFKLPFACESPGSTEAPHLCSIVTALIVGLILIPLNSLRRMSALKFTSFVAVGLIAFLVVSLSFRSVEYVTNHRMRSVSPFLFKINMRISRGSEPRHHGRGQHRLGPLPQHSHPRLCLHLPFINISRLGRVSRQNDQDSESLRLYGHRHCSMRLPLRRRLWEPPLLQPRAWYT